MTTSRSWTSTWVDDDEPLVDIDLGRGQAHAGRLVHGLRHVGDQPLQPLVEARHGTGDGLQARIGVLDDGKQSHFRNLLSRNDAKRRGDSL
jgi:hypothetical protein